MSGTGKSNMLSNITTGPVTITDLEITLRVYQPKPPPVKRPDGRLYQPKAVIAYRWDNDPAEGRGIIVLGTHDTARAQWLADRLAGDSWGEKAVNPVPAWWREAMRAGTPTWVSDEVRGRAGIMFDCGEM